MTLFARVSADSASGPARLPSAQREGFWVDEHFHHCLERAGLADFEVLIGNHGGRCLRRQRVRENWFLPAAAGANSAPGLYLKKHREESRLPRWLRWLTFGTSETPAALEVRNAARLEADGIPAMRIVAFGQRMRADGVRESLLVTEELYGYRDLDAILRLRRAPRMIQRRSERDQSTRRLIDRVAQLARRFHARGYNHRDFYCCHLFARAAGAHDFELRLIDLQRVEHRRFARRRWIIKDLSQLAWSVPAGTLTNSERMRFIKTYLGVARLRPCDRRLIREILLRQHVTARRLGTRP